MREFFSGPFGIFLFLFLNLGFLSKCKFMVDCFCKGFLGVS